MKLFRVHYKIDHGSSSGYGFFSSRRAVDAAIGEYMIDGDEAGKATEIEEIDVPSRPTRRELVKLLNRYGGHADNG